MLPRRAFHALNQEHTYLPLSRILSPIVPAIHSAVNISTCNTSATCIKLLQLPNSYALPLHNFRTLHTVKCKIATSTRFARTESGAHVSDASRARFRPCLRPPLHFRRRADKFVRLRQLLTGNPAAMRTAIRCGQSVKPQLHVPFCQKIKANECNVYMRRPKSTSDASITAINNVNKLYRVVHNKFFR